MIEEEEEQKNLPLNGERHFPISQKCVRSSERDTSGETKRETGGGRRIPCESREREMRGSASSLFLGCDDEDEKKRPRRRTTAEDRRPESRQIHGERELYTHMILERERLRWKERIKFCGAERE